MIIKVDIRLTIFQNLRIGEAHIYKSTLSPELFETVEVTRKLSNFRAVISLLKNLLIVSLSNQGLQIDHFDMKTQ